MDNNYIVIQGWMTSELNLSGNELLVYALIYGFSQDNESYYYGSRGFIGKMLNITLPTVDKALKSLLQKQLIMKEEMIVNGIRCVGYKTSLYPIKNLTYKESLYTYKESLSNNISNISNKDIKEYSNKDNKGVLEKDFEFGKPKKRKPNLYEQCVNCIDSKTQDTVIRKLLIQWLDMLLEKYRDKNKQLYLNVFKGKLNMLDKFDVKDWKEIIEYNLQRGYEGFYPIPFNWHADEVVSSRYNDDELTELKKLEEEREKNGLRTKF